MIKDTIFVTKSKALAVMAILLDKVNMFTVGDDFFHKSPEHMINAIIESDSDNIPFTTDRVMHQPEDWYIKEASDNKIYFRSRKVFGYEILAERSEIGQLWALSILLCGEAVTMTFLYEQPLHIALPLFLEEVFNVDKGC